MSHVVTVNAEQTALEAWEIMQQQGFRHLPVIDQQQQLQGIISDRDLLTKAVSQGPIGEVMQAKVLCAARQRPFAT